MTQSRSRKSLNVFADASSKIPVSETRQMMNAVRERCIDETWDRILTILYKVQDMQTSVVETEAEPTRDFIETQRIAGVQSERKVCLSR